tara:strand:- start:963 stop:2780 length:1818 start_codon:yes stop_codon:yes gene_type:complete
MNLGIREFLIWKIITISFLITISTEVLSYFNLITSISIRIFWGFFIIFTLGSIFFLRKKILFLKQNFHFKNKNFTFELVFILTISTLTFVNSLIYPPNTLDAMTYHMPKIMHWIQSGNIDFYPTDDLRQLIMAPFSEFVILHLYLFFGSDIFSNFVQWFSMFICIITVSLISKELGCNSKFQIFSVLFCSTLPMGILQSTSTQTDYVATMWLSIIVYFLIKYIRTNGPDNLIVFALTLAFGIFTKGTTYIFAFSFCIWLGLYVLMKNRNHIKYLIIVPLVILIINFGHFNRNMNFVGNPLGISNESPTWLNKTFKPRAFTSNLVRNIGLNLSVPNKRINGFTANYITLFLNKFDISTKDPKITKVPHRGYYIPFSFYESTAPNTLHFIIILFSIIFFFSKKKFNTTQKNYFYSVVFGFLFFSFLLIWTAQHNRYLLSFFVLFAPLVSLFLNKLELNKFTKILSIFLFLYSIPYVLFNKSRPLLAEMKFENGSLEFSKPFFLKETRNQLYFIADKFYNNRDLYNRDLYRYYTEVSEKIKSFNCKRIGFDSGNTNIEYPLWAILKSNSHNDKLKIYNVNVKNKSAKIDAENDNLCAIVYVDQVKILN